MLFVILSRTGVFPLFWDGKLIRKGSRIVQSVSVVGGNAETGMSSREEICMLMILEYGIGYLLLRCCSL